MTHTRQAVTDSEARSLVARWPLAQLVCGATGSLFATPLPLLWEEGEGHGTVVGHFGASNPQIAVLEAEPSALAIFVGPHGYLSPSELSDRTQAPTWHYATVQLALRVTVDRSVEAAHRAVDALTRHMERGSASPWRIEELGDRHDLLIGHVVAFTGVVTGVACAFKLGQTDREDVFEESCAALSTIADGELSGMMRRYRGPRPMR